MLAQNTRQLYLAEILGIVGVPKEHFEIASQSEKGVLCHFEERGDEAISHFSTAPQPPIYDNRNG